MMPAMTWKIANAIGWCKSYLPYASGYFPHRREFDFLRSSQWWSREALEDYQVRALQDLLCYAIRNVPYYENIFRQLRVVPKDFMGVADLSRIPVLTKETLIRAADDLISREYAAPDRRRILKESLTSGTTGTPLKVYLDTRTLRAKEAFFLYRNYTAGLPLYAKRVWIGGSPFRHAFETRDYRFEPFSRSLFLSSLALTPQRYVRYLQLLRAFKPDYVVGAPSIVCDLAECARQEQACDITFAVFFSICEQIFPIQQRMIEAQFRCRTYNYYSSQELSNLALDCRFREGMHVEMRHVIMEIVDAQHRLVPAGTVGKIICTGLINRAMPLIRYEIGDVGIISSRSCPCGRGLTVLQSLDGRNGDALRCGDRVVYPTPLSVIVEDFPFIRECQFVQQQADAVVVYVALKQPEQQSGLDEFAATVAKFLGAAVRVRIEQVAAIPRTRMGKFQLIANTRQPAQAEEKIQ